MLRALIKQWRAVRLLAAATAAHDKGNELTASQLHERAVAMMRTPRPGAARAALHVIPGSPDAADLEQQLSAANCLRDARQFAAAAQAYRDVLQQAPDRTDLHIQLGNMLKDSRQFEAAEAAYRHALSASPEDADAWVQLGHVMKLRGRRGEAMASYRQALLLDGSCTAAVQELAAFGDAPAQTRIFDANLRRGTVEHLLTLGGEIAALRERIDQLADTLPDPGIFGAIPVALYDRYRDRFTVPAPPTGFGLLEPVTVVLLVDREDLRTLYRQLAALRGQAYATWHLVALGATPERREVVLRAAAADSRITWTDLTVQPAEAELFAATSGPAGIALLLAPGAILNAQGLSWFAAAMRGAEVAAFVCDEDVAYDHWGSSTHGAPVFRSLVDYDTLLECNVFGETIALRTSSLLDIAPRLSRASSAALRSSLLLEFAALGAVGHIPYPLVSRAPGHAISPDIRHHAVAVAHHFEQAGVPAYSRDGTEAPRIVWRADPATVAVIVSTRDNALDVRTLVDSLRATAANPALLDIVVLDNGGVDSAHGAALARMEASNAIRLCRIDEPFNWSRLNGQGVALTEASILIFANDDMRMLSDGWDELVRGLLARPEVGAVGARLLYPDDTVQHAGILFGWHPSPTHHDGLHEPAFAPGPASRWRVTRAASAVTGAFLATRRDLFLSLGGFDGQALPVGYSDIDYALKVRASGRKVLWTPHIELHHTESKTRGFDLTKVEWIARDDAEREVLLQRWPGVLDSDPGVHPIWHPATLPFRLLRSYSPDRAMAYVRMTAARHPWAIPDPQPN